MTVSYTHLDACCRLLSPLEEVLHGYVMTDGKLHADDTPVQVPVSYTHLMDTEISSVNTSFVGVVFPVLPASPIKRVINARTVPPATRCCRVTSGSSVRTDASVVSLRGKCVFRIGEMLSLIHI